MCDLLTLSCYLVANANTIVICDLCQAVLWTLWSRLVRLHCYLRQLLAETPAHKLSNGAAAKRGDWGVLVENIDAEVG